MNYLGLLEPLFRKCSPCLYHYTAVVHMDTFNRDSRWILVSHNSQVLMMAQVEEMVWDWDTFDSGLIYHVALFCSLNNLCIRISQGWNPLRSFELPQCQAMHFDWQSSILSSQEIDSTRHTSSSISRLYRPWIYALSFWCHCPSKAGYYSFVSHNYGRLRRQWDRQSRHWCL